MAGDYRRMQPPENPPSNAHEFYRSAVNVLCSASLPFLVGGAYAMRVHTDIRRDTKDFDLLVRPQDLERTLEVLREAGFNVELTFSHWLAKVRQGPVFIDIIFRSGNGLCEVDDDWFKFARMGEVLGLQLPVCPSEEMLWQKAYIMERERYDGADVQHLLRSCGKEMDWERVLARFGPDWPVLLSHLVLFTYVYPGERESVPHWVTERMTTMLKQGDEGGAARLCRGPLLSRLQYLNDVEQWGYTDVRTEPKVHMTDAEIQLWTEAAREAEG